MSSRLLVGQGILRFWVSRLLPKYGAIRVSDWHMLINSLPLGKKYSQMKAERARPDDRYSAGAHRPESKGGPEFTSR